MKDAVEAFAREWAAHTAAERIELVSAADDARLTREALAAGEVQPVTGGLYYARSYPKDTARTEERTFVATGNPRDRGVYNNWAPADEMVPKVKALMAGASRGKTMYVIPYLMSNPGSPLAPWAAGVQLTDSRLVVLHMISNGTRRHRLARRHRRRPASFAACTSPATSPTWGRALRMTSATSSRSRIER